MKVLECLALVWCRKGEISAYTNWGIIVHFAMKRKRYFFNLVPRVFSQHPHACKDLLFAGRKAHVGGHPGHNFSLPRVKKIETWSLKTPLPQILSSDPPICMYVVSSSSSSRAI